MKTYIVQTYPVKSGQGAGGGGGGGGGEQENKTLVACEYYV